MQDRVPKNPNRWMMTNEETGESIPVILTRADNPSVVGSPLNAETFLPARTAALFGLPGSAVPRQVFELLANAAFDRNGAIKTFGGNPLGIQIATGTYTGTGTYGRENPNTLTFGFAPKLVIVYSCSDTHPTGADWMLMVASSNDNQGPLTPDNDNGMGYAVTVAFVGKSVSWYTSNPIAGQQANTDGGKYGYFAIGTMEGA